MAHSLMTEHSRDRREEAELGRRAAPHPHLSLLSALCHGDMALPGDNEGCGTARQPCRPGRAVQAREQRHQNKQHLLKHQIYRARNGLLFFLSVN